MLQTVALSKTALIYCETLICIYCKFLHNIFYKISQIPGGILIELHLSLEPQLLFLKKGVTFACHKVYGHFQLLEIFKGIYKYGLLIFQRCPLNLLTH